MAIILAGGVVAAGTVLFAQRQSATSPAVPSRETALALEQQGRVSEAEAVWRVLSRSNPRSAEPWLRIATLETHQEHYTDAAAAYRKAVTLDPSNGALRLNLGLALFKSGQFSEAALAFEAAHKRLPAGSPDAERIDILLGMTKYGLGHYADAVAPLRRAAGKDPENLPVRLTLAHSCLWSKQYDCVLDAYREILALNAESAEADMLAGEALDELNDSAGAVKMFRAAASANPNQPDVHFGLGYLLWKQKEFEEAAAEFRAELAHNSQHGPALQYLGNSYIALGKPELARAPLEQAVQVAPGLWRAHLDLGVLDAEAGRNDSALQSLQTAARLNPGEVNVHWRLARLYRAMGRTAESKAEFDKASSLTRTADEKLTEKMVDVPSESKTAQR